MAAAAAPPLTPDGWGALRIGVTEAELERRFALEAPDHGYLEWEACHERRLVSQPELVVMIQNGRVTRISLYDESPLRTDRGLRIGSREADVRRAYGRNLEVGPHAYGGESAHYLTAWTKPGERGIRYETDDDGVVHAIHAGDGSIRLIEGCS